MLAGIVIMGFLFGASAFIGALVTGQSLLMAFGLYVGFGALSILTVISAAMISETGRQVIQRWKHHEDPMAIGPITTGTRENQA